MLNKTKHLDTCYIKPCNFVAYRKAPDDILDLFHGKFLDNLKVFPVSTKINFC